MGEAGMVVVGAGKASARCIVGLREHGYEGKITLVSDEALHFYDRPPLSKSALVNEPEEAPALIVDADILASLKADVVAGTASWIETKAKLLHHTGGAPIPYDKLLIATGAVPRKLPDAPHALLLRTLDDSRALRNAFTPDRSVAIVGGGFIGLELASSASKRGCKVTVIEAQPRVLMRGVTEAVADVVAKRHAAAGVEIIASAAIAGYSPAAVTLKDGRVIASDILVAGIGAAPSTDLASGSYLHIDNGIACDAQLRTSDPDIFAAGDCCSFPHALFGGRRIRLEAWRAAQDMGAVVAENMLGASKTYEAVPWFWSDQYDLSLQIAGMPGDGAMAVTRRLKADAFIEFHLDGDGRLVGASGIGPGNSVARDIRLAEMLIAKRARPDPAQLADPAVMLKALLKP
jgi:3-phenylpropionate/trans-cinnamate dioxygenase ferredoxin reductase component